MDRTCAQVERRGIANVIKAEAVRRDGPLQQARLCHHSRATHRRGAGLKRGSGRRPRCQLGAETPVTCDTSRRWWRATRREAMRWSHYTFLAAEGKIPVLRADRRQENLATGTWMAHRGVWQLLTNSTAIAKMRALCSVSPERKQRRYRRSRLRPVYGDWQGSELGFRGTCV